MLEDSISAFTKDGGIWGMSSLKNLVGIARVGSPPRKKRLTIKNLMDRCGLTKDQAVELITLLNTPG
jgi:hypothetical protein